MQYSPNISPNKTFKRILHKFSIALIYIYKVLLSLYPGKKIKFNLSLKLLWKAEFDACVNVKTLRLTRSYFSIIIRFHNSVHITLFISFLHSNYWSLLPLLLSHCALNTCSLTFNTEWFALNWVIVFVQDPAVQPGASEAELLWDGEPVLSVCGGLPQGLLREWGQTTMAQRLDAGQVCQCVVCVCCCLSLLRQALV